MMLLLNGGCGEQNETSTPRFVHSEANEAGELWREGDFSGARNLYEEITESVSLPLDKAKALGNIAQLYKEEGDFDGALKAATAAVRILNENKLYFNKRNFYCFDII